MKAWRAAGKSIPGYGHPLHKERDERVGALFAVARTAGTDLRFVDIAEAVRARSFPRCWASRSSSTCRARFPRCCWAPAFRSKALKGVPILARTAGLIAHLVRGDAPADRLRALLPGDARDGIRRRRAAGLREQARMIPVLAGPQGHRAGHLHHRAGRRHAAGRPGRRRDQGRAAEHGRPVPRLQERPVQPALPDLQPQQAQHHARHQGRAATARCWTR